jgi:membrane protease YdiL (CAAX protease family)
VDAPGPTDPASPVDLDPPRPDPLARPDPRADVAADQPGPEAPSAPPLARPRALAFFLVQLALLPVGAAAQLLQPGLGLAWTQLALFAFPAAALAARAGLAPRAFLRLVRPPPRALGLALLIGVAAMLVGGALQALWSELLPVSLLRTFDVARLFQRTGWEQGLMIASAVGLAPVCEELAFRGHLLSALRLRAGPGVAIALSALAFAALHLDPVRLPGLLFLGLLYGWLTWRTGSVYPAVLAHAVNNAAATALALMGETADATTPLEPGAPAAALLVGLALLALPALALHRWLPPPPAAEAALAPGSRPVGRLPGWALAVAWAAVVSLSLIALAPRR